MLIDAIRVLVHEHEVLTGVKLDACECLPHTYDAVRDEVIAWMQMRIDAREVGEEFHDVRTNFGTDEFIFAGITFRRQPSIILDAVQAVKVEHVGFALYRRT